MAKTILVVDDSRIVLDVTEFFISSAGYRVYTATGGLQALEIMAQKTIDLAIVDINMPGMDGYTLTRKIRADKVFGEIPIIFITTEAEARDKKKGFDAGCNAYVVKPVQPEEVLAHIRLLIGEAL